MAEHVDVLVGDVLEVQKMQAPQRFQVRAGRLPVADALEIAIEKAAQITPSAARASISCDDIPSNSPYT
jgi:hypothetical protein